MSTGLINIAGVIITPVAQNLAVLTEVCPPVGGIPLSTSHPNQPSRGSTPLWPFFRNSIYTTQ